MQQRFQQSGHALGSAVYLTIVSDKNSSEVATQFETLWANITAFEQRFSRFLPGSELSFFNARAGQRTPVSEEFAALLHAAKHMAEKTGGLYNPFVLPGLQKAGYIGSWPTPQKLGTAHDYRARRVVPTSELHIGKGWARIAINSALDFGGIGKGYLLDLLGGILSRNTQGFWLSLGGDILCSGFDEDGSSWRIAVQSAYNASKSAGNYKNHNGGQMAVATSGTTKRQGLQAGKRWHHLIDPRTGEPADTDILTATVCCVTATEADVFAKCLVIDGSDRAQANLKHYGVRAALLQTSSSDSEQQIVSMGEWL